MYGLRSRSKSICQRVISRNDNFFDFMAYEIGQSTQVSGDGLWCKIGLTFERHAQEHTINMTATGALAPYIRHREVRARSPSSSERQQSSNQAAWSVVGWRSFSHV